ncbi:MULTISPECIES: PhoH family protein [Acidithiobacillus]|jgi:phosphate starvation-inducible PhoH-like protein|uniref:PhoH-like protein n=6 Tax=Acidithiobacillus TaxID=119977 RepID=A0A179BL96_ACIFR|nr:MULTISPECIES: PhoH family protein [Acidithiobacillus]MDA8152171.1 PhoH family protein [Acidithiobacillus sp.]OYV81256.1 MAG: phosphate starvation-inducible protein PhoH [Acidithiobacillus ferrivorans]MBU2848109.1 PhoH family protein [Acidithiobacillus ferriphilus]MBW9253954.1 AAA family ATPase [Acidithiobacillus ferriphilus]MDA8181991.1 PhoH family protein [Acidithiobacillus sp.]
MEPPGKTLSVSHSDFIAEQASAAMLSELSGELDSHIKQIESRLGVVILPRGTRFHITGPAASVQAARDVLSHLYTQVRQGRSLSSHWVHHSIQNVQLEAEAGVTAVESSGVQTLKGMIRGRGQRQRRYLESIRHNDLTFGIGPAGTGKTYLAVAAAVEQMDSNQVRRLVLVRPAVEAGERLGFLPGSLSEKVDPYLRPLYDALHEMLGYEKVAKLMERQVIEVAPLAYMRGRTLNDAFIILDEAQNTTPEQMKMFLTRMGFGAKVVVTGDVTQVDLPRGQLSGLVQVMDVLGDMPGVDMVFFESADVVRHPLVARIVEAYDRFGAKV